MNEAFIDRFSDPLHDGDPMPWGKWKGTPMQDVPADYFHYLWFNMGLRNQTKTNPVAIYIEFSLSALRHENPDLIWA